MTNKSLLTWLPVVGAFVWLSGRIVDSHPTYAHGAVLAALVFSTFVACPNPN